MADEALSVRAILAGEAPAGAPVTVKLTAPEKPPTRVTVAITGVLPPMITLPSVGDSERVIEPELLVPPLDPQPPAPIARTRAKEARAGRERRRDGIGHRGRVRCISGTGSL